MRSKYFQVIHDETDKLFAETVMEKADRLYRELINRFCFADVIGEERIAVTICDSVSKFLEEANISASDYQAWMVGNCDFKSRKIAILSPNVSTTHTAQGIEKVFAHEMIHMVFALYAGNTDAPIWCSEGIAVLYANQVELNSIDGSNCPRISVLLDGETFAERGGYIYAGVYVWYFIEQYGFAKFLDLYNNALDTTKLIYDGFEQDAIRTIKESVAKRNAN